MFEHKFEKFKDKYTPTSDGHIYSMWTNKTLKESLDLSGYPIVSLVDSDTKNKSTTLVHQFIAYFLVPGYQEGLVVNHKDGNKQNNHPSNLEWITQKENIAHAKAILGTRNYDGENHPMYNKKHTAEAKLKMSEARKRMTGEKHWRSRPVVAVDYHTSDFVGEYPSENQAAKSLSLSQGNVHMVLNNKRKYTKGYKFYYKDDYVKHNKTFNDYPEKE